MKKALLILAAVLFATSLVPVSDASAGGRCGKGKYDCGGVCRGLPC